MNSVNAHTAIRLAAINKMRYLIIILIFFSVVQVYGQEVSINIIDSKGLKQGKWRYEKIDTCHKYYIRFNIKLSNSNAVKNDSINQAKNSKEKLYIQEIRKCIYHEGNYTDNQKVGLWKYYQCIGNYCNIKQLLVYEISHLSNFDFDTLRKFDDSEKMKLELIKGKEMSQSEEIKTQNSDYLISSSGVLKDSILNGILKTYYDNGILKSVFEFLNNKPIGKFKCFYENGKIKFYGEIIPNSDFAIIKEYYNTGAFRIEKKLLLEKLLNEWSYYNELQ